MAKNRSMMNILTASRGSPFPRRVRKDSFFCVGPASVRSLRRKALIFSSILTRKSSTCSNTSGVLRTICALAGSILSAVNTSSNPLMTSSTDVVVDSKRKGKDKGGGTKSVGLSRGGFGGSSILRMSSDFIRSRMAEERRAVPDTEKSMNPRPLISWRSSSSRLARFTSHGLTR